MCTKSGCSLPVMNKKYGLCQRHNWERQHPGKDYFKEKNKKAQITQQKMLDKQRMKPKKIYKFNPKPSGPIKKKTDKRKKEEEIYQIHRKEHLLDNPYCKVCLDLGIKKEASEIHHIRGRSGIWIYIKKFFLSVCREHHEWIEANGKEAKRLGYSVTRII